MLKDSFRDFLLVTFLAVPLVAISVVFAGAFPAGFFPAGAIFDLDCGFVSGFYTRKACGLGFHWPIKTRQTRQPIKFEHFLH